MRQAHLICGFSNWGKSRTIFDLFRPKKRFYYDRSYRLRQLAVPMVVQSQSNDDVGINTLIWRINHRLNLTNAEVPTPDLIAAVCPTLELPALLRDSAFDSFDQINLFLLRTKYDNLAQLRIPDIRQLVQADVRVNIIVIDGYDTVPIGQRADARVDEVWRQMQLLYP